MRVVLITGKGGTGKTTMAAITALRAADLGHRTLVVSSDAAHSLSDVFGQRIGPEVVSITETLSARELDAQTLFDASWSTIRDYLQELLEWAGAASVRAEELAVVPGLEELLALRAIARHLHEPWDAVIVDCAPTAETVRLLALPATIRHYLEHVLPSHRRLARTLAPLLRRRVSLPPTPSGVLDAALSLVEEVRALHDTIADPATTEIRLVTTPESMVVAETRRVRTHLELFGYVVGSLFINRVAPCDAHDPWLAEVRLAQEPHLQALERTFTDLGRAQAPMRPSEITGLRELRAFGLQVYGAHDPISWPRRIRSAETPASTANVMRVPMAGAQREDVHIARSGTTVLVTVGPMRRAISVPAHLHGRTATSARIVDGHLEVEFDAV